MKVYKINENIKKYRFGNPINTESVVLDGIEIDENKVKFIEISINSSSKINYLMNDEDIILGLGENLGGINKRGRLIESFCSDDPIHVPDRKSLYSAHNFLIVEGKNRFGLYIDYPSKIIFDLGFKRNDNLEIIIDDNNFDLYIIEGDSPKKIVKEFLKLIGKSYIPPKWAFGFQQCRWSYVDSKEVLDIANKFIENDIPCDSIYLDIDYMEDFKDFTVDNQKFPNFKEYVEEIKEKGFKLVPIIDAGVKIEKGYDVYEEGLENGYFCVDKNKKPFIGAVWPGYVHFPDFLNPKTRIWFGLKYKKLVDLGIEGFWNDMNEPAIFYTVNRLNDTYEKIIKIKGKNLDIYDFFNLKDLFINLSNNNEDYKSFYHNFDGKFINHYDVHNLYGYYMTRSAAEGLNEIDPNRRFLLFSRSSYIGMHRYGGIWTGDNHSWWEHILLNIRMMPSLNMCGFLYSGADTGGFGGNANSELVIRWSQFSLFTPLFRNHSALGTRSQEPFSFDDKTTDIMRNIIRFRYSLIPYIYSEFMKAARLGDVYFSPLLFVYQDEFSRRVEDQLLVGDSIMVSPIYEENSRGRYVWLPEDMILWKVNDYRNRNYELLRKGHHYIDVKLDEIPLFIRKNKLLVLGNHAKNVDSIDNKELNIIAFVEDKCSYVYYDDDGVSKEYEKGKYSEIHICIERTNDDIIINVENKGNKHIETLNFEIIDINNNKLKRKIQI